MPTPSEMALYSLLNQMEEVDKRRAKAIQELARATSELARKDAWRRADEALLEGRVLSDKLMVAWAAVKDGVVARAVSNG